jgi:hypothetical protein
MSFQNYSQELIEYLKKLRNHYQPGSFIKLNDQDYISFFQDINNVSLDINQFTIRKDKDYINMSSKIYGKTFKIPLKEKEYIPNNYRDKHFSLYFNSRWNKIILISPSVMYNQIKIFNPDTGKILFERYIDRGSFIYLSNDKKLITTIPEDIGESENICFYDTYSGYCVHKINEEKTISEVMKESYDFE